MLANGDDPTKVTDASFNARLQVDQEGRRLGQIRQFTGQRLRRPAREGRPQGLLRVVGRHGQLQIGNPHLQWNLPKDGGLIWTDNMLIPKGGNVYTASRLHELRTTTRRSGPARSRTTSTTSARWSARRSLLEEDRPGDRKEHADLPDEGDARAACTEFDPNALNNEKYNKAWQDLTRALKSRHGIPPSHRGLTPYLLLAPGILYLARVLHRPARLPREPVTRVGQLRRRLRVHVGVGQLLRTRSRTTAAVHSLARVRGDSDDARARARATRSRTGSRSAAGGGRTCCS